MECVNSTTPHGGELNYPAQGENEFGPKRDEEV